jgi:hypothetical protein
MSEYPIKYLVGKPTKRLEFITQEHDNLRQTISRLKIKRELAKNVEEAKVLEREIRRLNQIKQEHLIDLTKAQFHARLREIHELWLMCVTEIYGEYEAQECVKWLENYAKEHKNV